MNKLIQFNWEKVQVWRIVDNNMHCTYIVKNIKAHIGMPTYHRTKEMHVFHIDLEKIPN